MKPAVVVSSHIAGLGVIRALGMAGVPTVVVRYEHGDMGYMSKYVRETVSAPHPEKSEPQFIEHLVQLALRLGGGLLIPTSDTALCVISKHKQQLEKHYSVACTEWNISEKFIDKKNTYALADAIGVPAPKTLIPRCMDDVEKFAATTLYPCVVKPSQAHLFRSATGTRDKWVKASSAQELKEAYRRAEDAGMDVLLQEFIPGDETHGANYNSYFWDGEPLIEFTAEKIRNCPPDTGSPCVVVSKKVPEILAPGRRLLQAMGFYGYSCTEFKRDPRDGVYKLIEVNGRHNLSSLLAPLCGINFPWLQYRHLTDGVVPAASEYREGVHWIDITRDFACLPHYLCRKDYSLGRFLSPYFAANVYAVLNFNDPKPALRRLWDLYAQLWRRSFGRGTRPTG